MNEKEKALKTAEEIYDQRPDKCTFGWLYDQIARAILEAKAEEAERSSATVTARFYQQFTPDSDVDSAWKYCAGKLKERAAELRKLAGEL